MSRGYKYEVYFDREKGESTVSFKKDDVSTIAFKFDINKRDVKIVDLKLVEKNIEWLKIISEDTGVISNLVKEIPDEKSYKYLWRKKGEQAYERLESMKKGSKSYAFNDLGLAIESRLSAIQAYAKGEISTTGLHQGLGKGCDLHRVHGLDGCRPVGGSPSYLGFRSRLR